jgi:hypothetical protein
VTEEPTARQLATVGRVFKAAIWFIATIVIAFSTAIGHDLLHDRYNVPDPAAWILTPAIDLGLCAGLYATGVLNRYGISVGWLTAVRWVCGFMTLWLNCAAAVLDRHPGEAFTHAFPAVLLVILTEADQMAQGAMLRRIHAAEASEKARAQAAADKKEAARAAELAAAQNATQVRAQVLAELRDEFYTQARVDAEPALRAELAQAHAQELTDLRAHMEEDLRAQVAQAAAQAHAQAVRETRAELRTQGSKPGRAGSPQPARTPTDQVALTDEAVAENLWDLYEKHRTETGEPLSTYKVRTHGPCSSGKDLRVLALLDERWSRTYPESLRATNVTPIKKEAVQ